ncbi:MAG: AAA family ATPase, partial [Candidatus Bathyarchaeia archaeon]
VDLSSFIPSESALKSLDQAVKTLQNHLENRENNIGEIEREISETQGEIARLSEALAKLESEIDLVEKSIHQTGLNIKHAEKNIEDLQNLLEKEKAQVELYVKRQDEMAREEEEKQKELDELKKQIDLSRIHEMEIQREALGNEIIALRQKNGGIETELSTLQSKMENVLKASLENATIQLSKVSKQIPLLEKEVEDAVKERSEVEKKIEELEKEKETLSRSLLNSREEAEKYTSQIDTIDSQLQQIEKEYEQADRLNNELKLNLQTLHLLLDKNKEQLKSLGYEEPLDISPRQVQEAESMVKLMKFELERIGAVNQLAQTQYAEQISKYKELSIRMNELEKEKKAIIDFIENIEQKKYKVFMEAFNQINQKLDKYFSKLTGGGKTTLQLENPENPFAGGVDMIVQFLNKPPILISGASSGERSVAAVAFLFALQEFTPASFYLFDEIDAHLDAFHVERLGELLTEEAANSQFLVVTLKPEMVSKAERIYGVYGREGVSHIVSTTFKGVV